MNQDDGEDEESDSVRSDLGYTESKRSAKTVFRIPYSVVPLLQHEPLEKTEARRESLKSLIEKTFSEITEKDGAITAQRGNKKFTLWPATDCYYSHSIEEYRTGIEELCEKVKRFL